MKTKVAVLFGGKSVEHEVSIISGLQAFAALDRTKYAPLPLYIAKDNRLYTGPHMGDIAAYRVLPRCLAEATRVLLSPATGGGVELLRDPPRRFGGNTVGRFEVAIPVVHGTNAEDGTLMGMLEMLGVPYAASDVTSSAAGMDKWLMKAALRAAGLPVLDALIVTGRRYALEGEAVMNETEERFGYPVIVKPVNLGSSVGISRANDRAGLAAAMDTAAAYSPRFLVEPAIEQLREINCAVLGDGETAEASVCEEPVGADEILSYRDKYLGGGKGSKHPEGMNGLKRRCPADLPAGLAEQVRRLAVDTFQALHCCGVARVDFLNDLATGQIWVNEINTIPGSLAFYLWEASGIPFHQLLDRMIALAFKRQREREALTFSYDSNLLSGVVLGAKTGKV